MWPLENLSEGSVKEEEGGHGVRQYLNSGLFLNQMQDRLTPNHRRMEDPTSGHSINTETQIARMEYIGLACACECVRDQASGGGLKCADT